LWISEIRNRPIAKDKLKIIKKKLRLRNKQEIRSYTNLKGTSTKKKVNKTIQEARERFNEQLEKITHLSIVMKDLKLHISKFVNNKGLIYLRTRNFRNIKECSAE